MRVGILHTIESEPDLFSPLFKSVNAPFEYQVFEITQGEFPASPGACDAFLVSGSEKGVYDPDPWIADLAAFIKLSHQTRKKLVGICFGHQLIAHALGGQTSKSEKGWGLGLREFAITTRKPWMEPVLDHCSLYFVHQDQVTALPAGAEALGGNDFCPYAVYCIGDRVLGIQGHPEFSSEFMDRIMDLLKEQVGSTVYDAARHSLRNGLPDAKIVTRWLINFMMLTDYPYSV